jgi:hypothetical protein
MEPDSAGGELWTRISRCDAENSPKPDRWGTSLDDLAAANVSVWLDDLSHSRPRPSRHGDRRDTRTPPADCLGRPRRR